MKMIKFAAAALACLIGTSHALAQVPNRIKQNNAWGAYEYKGDKGKICYLLSVPTEKLPADRDHGDVFFMVSNFVGENIRLEPQFTVGYPFKDNSKVVIDIDGKKFSMFTRGSNAWLENPAEEPQVVAAMRAGRSMEISGQSRRGTETKYKYSLSGVTASIAEVQKCSK